MENLVNLEILSSFYRNKKIFITGHTGFKGAWLTAILHLAGAEIKAYSLPPEYFNGIFEQLHKNGALTNVFADIRDRERLEKEITAFQPDYVFHLAAQPLVRRSYKQPAETFEINVTGTANLLQSIRQLEKKCTALIVTTDKVYENKEQPILYREEDRLGGHDPYSASKACAEILTQSFRNSFFHPASYTDHQKAVTTARAGNVIGGGDWSEDRIIPDIVRALQGRNAIEVRNPQAVRPWQHVLEPLAGYLTLAALLNADPVRYAQPYNFGPLPDDHLTVGQLVELVIKTWGEGSWNDASKPGQPHEAGLLKLSIEKAQKELGWQPRLDAAAAVEWTLNWYKNAGGRELGFSIGQIQKYFSL